MMKNLSRIIQVNSNSLEGSKSKVRPFTGRSAQTGESSFPDKRVNIPNENLLIQHGNMGPDLSSILTRKRLEIAQCAETPLLKLSNIVTDFLVLTIQLTAKA
jgi:hypothetical protein